MKIENTKNEKTISGKATSFNWNLAQKCPYIKCEITKGYFFEVFGKHYLR